MDFTKKWLIFGVLLLILGVVIVYIVYYPQAHLPQTNTVSTLQKLKSIAQNNNQANQMLKDNSTQINYKKLSSDQIQSFIKSGLISTNVSDEVYSVDFISSKTNSGITLLIDLENKNLLKVQTVVGVSVG